MGNTFSLDPSEFASQAPVLVSAGDQLDTALTRLQAVITTEGNCWGNDEPGQAFAKTYEPDADTTIQNIRNLAATLRDTGSAVQKTADNLTNQDLNSGADLNNSGSDDNAASNGYTPYGTAPASGYSPGPNGTPSPQPDVTGTATDPTLAKGVSPTASSTTPYTSGNDSGNGTPNSATQNPAGTQATPAQPSQNPNSAPDDRQAAAPRAKAASRADAAPRAGTSSTVPTAPPATAASSPAAAAGTGLSGAGFGSRSDKPNTLSPMAIPGTSGPPGPDAAERGPMSPGALPRPGKKDEKKKTPKGKKGTESASDAEPGQAEPVDRPPVADRPLSAAEIRRGAERREPITATPWSGRATSPPSPVPHDPDRG